MQGSSRVCYEHCSSLFTFYLFWFEIYTLSFHIHSKGVLRDEAFLQSRFSLFQKPVFFLRTQHSSCFLRPRFLYKFISVVTCFLAIHFFFCFWTLCVSVYTVLKIQVFSKLSSSKNIKIQHQFIVFILMTKGVSYSDLHLIVQGYIAPIIMSMKHTFHSQVKHDRIVVNKRHRLKMNFS